MYAVFRTARFDKQFLKQLSPQEQEEIEHFEKKQLTTSPYLEKTLGYRFFREKKIDGKRIYYLIYEELQAILLVGISDKKTQHETIEEIKGLLKLYYETVREALKQHGGSGHT